MYPRLSRHLSVVFALYGRTLGFAEESTILPHFGGFAKSRFGQL
jgi:hypothetical protein